MNKYGNKSNLNKRSFKHWDRNMVLTNEGAVAKSKKIQEKNTVKGQGSLAAFFGNNNP